MKKFHHRGSLGDIIYSLPSIISSGGGILYLRKKFHYDFLKPLLVKQNYISDVFCEEELSEIESHDAMRDIINLDEFRKIHKRDLHKHLVSCHLEVLNQTFDLSQSWLFNIEAKFKAKIIINRTSRYHDKEEVRWKLLKKYKRDCLFIGYKKEFKKFGLNVSFYQCEDALEMAQIIKGSSLFIGNQSVGFALAEAMKHSRVLEVFYDKNNCQPQSSNGYTYLTNKIIESYIKDSDEQDN